MSEFQTQNDDDVRFDRLVDGEATPNEYRELLAALEDEPGGWRRCAMAFLEDQALRRELGALRDEAVEGASHDNQTIAEQPAANSPAFNRTGMLLAMAASFLIAFGLGYVLRSTSIGDPPRPEFVAEDNPGELSLERPQDSQLAGNSSEVGGSLTTQPEFSPQPLENVTLVVGNNETDAERFELPVVHYGDVGDEYFRTERTAMPRQMREMLQRQGHQLRRTQGYVPVEMEDGRRLVVPVEEVEIVPVGLPAF